MITKFSKVIEEGRNAGVWTVGITRTGNLVGVSEDKWNNTGAAERASLLQSAKSTLEEAGVDYVIESVAELEPVLADIERRLRLESLRVSPLQFRENRIANTH